jgi:hypothetical protein
MKNCAVTAESCSHVYLRGKSARRTRRIYGEGEVFVHLRSNFWFEDEGDILVIGMDMTDGQPRTSFRMETNFAYSIRDSVT